MAGTGTPDEKKTKTKSKKAPIMTKKKKKKDNKTTNNAPKKDPTPIDNKVEKQVNIEAPSVPVQIENKWDRIINSALKSSQKADYKNIDEIINPPTTISASPEVKKKSPKKFDIKKLKTESKLNSVIQKNETKLSKADILINNLLNKSSITNSLIDKKEGKGINTNLNQLDIMKNSNPQKKEQHPPKLGPKGDKSATKKYNIASKKKLSIAKPIPVMQPPKSGQSSGKPRKKNEKDRLKKEEAEAAAQAEEIRLNLEREMKEREATERALLDERRRLEEERFFSKKELAHRTELLSELNNLWEKGRNTFAQDAVQERSDSKWARYMLCNGSPDPTNLGEIHTFITLHYENDKRSKLPEVLEDSKLILKLNNELQGIILDTPSSELPENLKKQYLETIEELQMLLAHKLDIGCQRLLLSASSHADEETANLQKVFCDSLQNCYTDACINVCIWANLSKNPRFTKHIKNHTFEELNLTFEIAKPLILTGCAIRFQRMRYDHFSPKTATYYARPKARVYLKIKKDTISKVIEELKLPETTSRPSSGKAKSTPRDPGTSVKDGPASVASNRSSRVKDDASRGKSPLSVKPDSARQCSPSPNDERNAGNSARSEAKEISENPDRDEPTPVEYEDFVGDLDSVDMRSNHVLGGVFYFNLIKLPPQSKVVNGWVMTQVSLPIHLAMMDYQEHMAGNESSFNGSHHGSIAGSARPSLVAAGPGGSIANNNNPDTKCDVDNNEDASSTGDSEDADSSHTESTGRGEKKLMSDQQTMEGLTSSKLNTLGTASSMLKVERQSIGLSMKLPSDVYFCEEPQIVRWNESMKEWRTEGFTDIKFDEEQRMLSMKTADFGLMALIQDAHMNMPFQSWELRPRGINHVTFIVIAAIVECEFEVKDCLCRLVQPNRPELAHLCREWFKPRDFIRRMRLSGLNIFPDVDSSKYVTTQSKSHFLEHFVYRQMALTASSVAYSWSKWNAMSNKVLEEKNRSLHGITGDKFTIFQSAEHLKDEHLLEEEWYLHLVTKRRSIRLKMNEFSEKFTDDHAAGSEFYPSLYHLNKALCSPAAMDRISATSNDFVHTLYFILTSVRPLIYS